MYVFLKKSPTNKMEILVLVPHHKTLSFLRNTEIAIGPAERKEDYAMLNSSPTVTHVGVGEAVMIAFLSNRARFQSLSGKFPSVPCRARSGVVGFFSPLSMKPMFSL